MKTKPFYHTQGQFFNKNKTLLFILRKLKHKSHNKKKQIHPHIENQPRIINYSTQANHCRQIQHLRIGNQPHIAN